MPKSILVIGSGGREHAICWKLSQSDWVDTIYCAPGNGGTAVTRKTRNIAIPVTDVFGLIQFAQSNAIDLTVVGPDNPLAEGIVDSFEAAGLRIFGPEQAAARLESSKAFSKQFMKTHKLPTAAFEVFDNKEDALHFCATYGWARVIKVDGLALGKGVYLCDTLEDCREALAAIFDEGRFGESGRQVVIEERLQGPEISLMMLCDGKTLLPLASSQDYKRRLEGNTGPNTGGMGAFSPVPDYEALQSIIETQVIRPLEQALQAADFTFKGVLYAGLLIQEGEPYILEFNARFGDPETQCVLPRLKNDFYVLLDACVKGALKQQTLQWSEESSVCVVACTESYPESGSEGQPITLADLPEGVLLFHAGTRLHEPSHWVTCGGRVLNMVALGSSLSAASESAYKALSQIHFPGMAYRQDIAKEVSPCLLK